MQRTITGAASLGNRLAVDWSPLCGLVASGSNSLVVVADPFTLQTLQVLEKHRSTVMRVVWARSPTSKHPADRLTLASSDATGHIVIWNAKSGQTKAILQDGPKAVTELAWCDGRYENTGHLLAALHPPFALVLWDTSTGAPVWRKTYTETLQGFDFDPFDASRLAFRCLECVLFVDDFNPTKAPQGAGRKFYVLGPARSSPNRSSGFDPNTPVGTPMGPTPPEDKGKARRTRIKKIMKDLVMGEFQPQGSNSLTLSDCLQVLYHRSVRNHLLLVYPREVLILDLDIGQTVGLVSIDRTSTPILQVYPCRHRDAIYILSESGTLSLRVRKRLYGVASTPIEPIRNMSKAVSTSSIASINTLDTTSENFTLDNVLEIFYEQKAHSDCIRLQKHAKILGMALDTIRENSVTIFTSDGRLILVDIAMSNQKSGKMIVYSLPDLIPPTLSMHTGDLVGLKLFTRGIVSGLCLPAFHIRMCPPLTMKNLSEYVPYMAVGGQNGNIQLTNMSTGRIERDFAVHTYPVRGLEWTSLNTVLSHAHQNLLSSTASNVLVRNELIHTDVRTGKTHALRSHRSEEPAIEMLRVSHLKQYFIVAFQGAPFELWDLRTMTLLRTMPKKFPAITALDWSPLHNLKSLKRKMHAVEEKENKKGDTDSDHAKDEDGSKVADKASNSTIVAKEHFVFTDPDGQLYHFSVEGNAIKDGTKVPAESSLGTITCIAWKSDHIVRGDSDGNINVWDVKTRTSRNIATNRGPIKKMRFAPGRGNLKLLILNPDSVSIWDVRECELINELRTPKDMVKVMDIDWAASDRPVLATVDGCLRVMGLALASASSAMYEYNVDESAACHALLPNKERTNFQILLHHQPWKPTFSLDFSSADGFDESSLTFVKEQIGFIRQDIRSQIEDPATSTALRSLLASQISGMKWEADFWRLALSTFNPKEFGPVDTNFDLALDAESYLRFHIEKMNLHQSRCSTHAQRKRVVDLMLCLDQKEEAIRLLLDTESDSPNYYEDSLKACLVASTAAAQKDTPHSTTKLVATNLIAEGKLWEGVQLLCLIDKVVDACNYLQSCGQWDASLWLAKCRLSGHPDLTKVAGKYCEHLLAKDQKKQAILIYLSLKDFVSTLDCLVSAKMIALAAQFLQACQEMELLPDTSHMMVLNEEISLAYARHLFDTGNAEGAFYYCDKADEKGEILRRELEMLSNSKTLTVPLESVEDQHQSDEESKNEP